MAIHAGSHFVKLCMHIISVSIARVFSQICARVAPRVLHFSAFIIAVVVVLLHNRESVDSMH